MQRLPLLLSLLALPLFAQGAARHDFEPVRREIAELVAEGDAVGVVALVERGGERLLAEAAGELAHGGGALRLDSIFRIYSMTKPVTAVGALTLLDAGKFGLDDPVAKYLPELAELRAIDPEDPARTVPLERPLRVRDLFQHTSGWSYETPWREVAAKRGVLDPDLSDMVRALAELPLEFQPGTRWQYGISNDVLGALVERVAQQPLDEFLAARVFVPLKMVDTGFSVREEQLARVATLHVAGRGGLVPADDSYVIDPMPHPRLIEGGAGLFSTAGDYARFLKMLLGRGELEGVRVLRPETVALMTTDQVGKVPKDATLVGRDYGLGIAITNQPFDAGTPGTWTWGGAAGTSFWVDPSTDTIAVFLVQNWLDFGPAIRFGAAVARAFAAPAPLPAEPEPPAAGGDGRSSVLF